MSIYQLFLFCFVLAEHKYLCTEVYVQLKSHFVWAFYKFNWHINLRPVFPFLLGSKVDLSIFLSPLADDFHSCDFPSAVLILTLQKCASSNTNSPGSSEGRMSGRILESFTSALLPVEIIQSSSPVLTRCEWKFSALARTLKEALKNAKQTTYLLWIWPFTCMEDAKA